MRGDGYIASGAEPSEAGVDTETSSPEALAELKDRKKGHVSLRDVHEEWREDVSSGSGEAVTLEAREAGVAGQQ